VENEKKRLLYISTHVPGSTYGGTEMRAANHILALSELFEVTLAIVGDHGSEAEVRTRLSDNLMKACVSVLIICWTPAIIRRLRRTWRFQVRVLLEALWPTPLFFAPYPTALSELGRRLRGQHFDVVHCFRLNTGLLRRLKRHGVSFTRSVLDFDSYESRAEFRSIRTFRSLVGSQMSFVSWLKATKWWALESQLIPSFEDGLVCAESDRQKLRRRFPRTQWHVVPNVVPEPPKFRAVTSDRFTFLFVGQLGYLPNWDAVMFFCTDVLPILRPNAPGPFRVLIVGRPGGDPDRLAGIEEVRVVLNPPDLLPYYSQSDAVIVPLRGGGGTRVKILEAFSYGLPVVSTTIGAEGLDVTSGSDIIIADGAAAFAKECLRIWRDDILRRQIAAMGHDLWRRKYSAAALASALGSIYKSYPAMSLAR
jgi:glycosyltransferase involved in cell wall biosynthesis